jgi:ribosomal protein S18 acetylase RimI-like enzyme
MLTIREAPAEEEGAVVDLICRAFEPITMFRRIEEKLGPFNRRSWKERLRARTEKSVGIRTVLVGIDGRSQIVATALGGYDPAFRLAFLDMLAVEPECHGQGCGREMVRAFEEWAREQGAEAAHLDCLTDNDAGNKLYEAEGYSEVARQIIWVKRLAEADGE